MKSVCVMRLHVVKTVRGSCNPPILSSKLNLYKKEGQESLIRSSEFCLKLPYTYPLKASHVPGTPGAGPNLALWHNLNKLGRGLLGHSTYQISRLSALWFQTRRFFHGFPYISLSKTCDPWNRAIMAPGE